MIDIKSDSPDLVAARLSNFTARKFTVNGVACSSLEAILQSLKTADAKTQIALCKTSSRYAQKKGQEYNNWKDGQTLWWNGSGYKRQSPAYAELLKRIYDAAYEQDPTFREDLLATNGQPLCHSIGKSNPRDTVLTEDELIFQLKRLHIRAQKERREL